MGTLDNTADRPGVGFVGVGSMGWPMAARLTKRQGCMSKTPMGVRATTPLFT